MKIRCDVIIPIYNAYDATKECVASVICNTDLKFNGLILINDCSTDDRISPYIAEIKRQNNDLNITVIENENNLGFVGTVNRAMQLSDSDVLLLNSDTEVGENWLDNIKRCAYSQHKVATVTPLSNNATLVSAPIGLQRNEIREDISLNEYNLILEKCSYRDYPELPTAHGFCMYIRRQALDTVGFFDEESFGRGYGEENDFSLRCCDYGFKNLLCDDTIVYHKESQSFSGERQLVLEEHMKTINERYPEFEINLASWCRRFPIKYICKNIDYNLKLNNRRNILILIHDWTTTTGGTTLHVMDLIRNLRNKYNFHVLFPNEDRYIVHSYFADSDDLVYLPFKIENTTRYNRYNRNYYDMCTTVVKALNIDTVHIHHMMGHYFDIADVVQEYNLNSVITLHDFYSICPSVNLLYCGNKFCMNLENKDCKKCLSSSRRAVNNIVADWQNDWHSFLKRIKTIIVPSDDTKDRIIAVYNDLKINVIEHGVDIFRNNYSPVIKETFNVAFIGVMCNHKGANVIKKLIDSNKTKNIIFHIFGTSEIEDLTVNKANYIYHGRYERSNLSNLLRDNNINLICFFQIWPETYSYTLNEAVVSGIPVLSFDIGAGAERVKKYGLGWTIAVDSDINTIADTLNNISANGDMYNNTIKQIYNYSIKTINQMTDEYKPFYDDTAGLVCTPNSYDSLRYIIKNEQITQISNYQSQLNDILNSAKWRLVNKIKIPTCISRPIKKVIKFLFKIIRGK